MKSLKLFIPIALAFLFLLSKPMQQSNFKLNTLPIIQLTITVKNLDSSSIFTIEALSKAA